MDSPDLDQDVLDADRGFIATRTDPLIRAADGRVVWDLAAYDFLEGAPCPDTAHPALWRQSRLCRRHGLYEVVEGLYQVRGFDLSNITFVEGDAGVVVIDPLISVECAAAALELYREHRGPRPVTAVIYTHSHVDHFGGVKGVVDPEDVAAGRVPVVAPEHFLEHAVSENVMAGTAMTRRAGYMYGAALEKGPAGQIGTGLGQTASTGTVTLIAPTHEVTRTGEELVLDGVRLVFQLTPNTEAPAEMNFYFPDLRVLCVAENATHCQHNVLTIRGAQVRDAKNWSRYLNETITLWGDELDVVFACHHWPTWGRERAVEFLALQRDLYGYLHDQTLRLMNQGYTGEEIGDLVELPPALRDAPHALGSYGSVSHNCRGIYERYLGFYDGNPAHLWRHPPVEAARRYVAAMGGADAAVAEGRRALEAGDLRWAAEVLDRVLFAQEDHAEARELQAQAFERLGHGCENGTWRNAYLAGAHELRHGIFGTPSKAGTDMAVAMTVDQLLAGLAVRVDGPRCWDEHLVVALVVSDEDQTHRVELRNGVLNHQVVEAVDDAEVTVTFARAVLVGLVTGARQIADVLGAGELAFDGDPSALGRLMGALAPVDPDFAIVTP